VAKGSEGFSWKLYGTPLEERICAICDTPLRVKDVIRHHTIYREGKEVWTGFFCKQHVLGRTD
jgi:hypothetical protein